jgi:hypothetical protein
MKTNIIASAILTLVLMSGCQEDFLKDRAYSIITEDNYFKTSSDAITAVNGVYSALRAGGMYETDMLYLNEYPTECVTSRLTIGEVYSRFDIWQWQVGDLGSIYSANYALIERANQVIANVPKIDMLESLKNRVIGEATFLRSLAYFNLVRVYGGVPLKLNPTTDFSSLSFPRATAAEVYQQIIDDLTWVYESAGMPKTSSYGASDKGRVGRSAVQALLGKVYLTRASDATVAQSGDYQKAAEILRVCVSEGDRSLQASYSDVFSMTNENNSEIIFDVQYLRKAGLGGSLTQFISTDYTQELFGISYYNYPASIDFYKSFDPLDQRRPVTFYDRMSLKVGSETFEVYYDPTGDPATGMWRKSSDNSIIPANTLPSPAPGFRKFVDTDKTARIGSEEPNFTILRYSDVLLMLAEAINEANNGPTAEAYSSINQVKRRAMSKPIDVTDPTIDYAGLDKAGFRKALYGERRKEFVLECQGWFDGKRFWDIFTKAVADESIGANPLYSYRPKTVIDLGTIQQDKNKLLPFTVNQLDLNNGLIQNPGYDN